MAKATDDATETPAHTLEAATETEVLPRRGMILLGTVVGGESATAIVQIRPGEIRTVSTGDRLGTATVTAIAPGALYLAQGAQNRRLTLPGG